MRGTTLALGKFIPRQQKTKYTNRFRRDDPANLNTKQCWARREMWEMEGEGKDTQISLRLPEKGFTKTVKNWNPYRLREYREACFGPVLYQLSFSRGSRRPKWRQTPAEVFTCESVVGVCMFCPVFTSKTRKCPSSIPPPTARTAGCQGHQSMALKVQITTQAGQPWSKWTCEGDTLRWAGVQRSARTAALLELWSKGRS